MNTLTYENFVAWLKKQRKTRSFNTGDSRTCPITSFLKSKGFEGRGYTWTYYKDNTGTLPVPEAIQRLIFTVTESECQPNRNIGRKMYRKITVKQLLNRAKAIDKKLKVR